MIIALFMNMAGLTSGLVTPRFIGWVLEAINNKDWDYINNLAIIWFIITAVSSYFDSL